MPKKTYMESVRRWLVPLATTVLTPVVSAGEFVLAERGCPAKCAIVLSSSASDSERHAALELRDYVKQITGVELPVSPEASGKAVRIVLDDAYGDDGFRLKAEGSDLFVRGGKRGVLYGVYEILETHGGVGWFSSWRTVVPRRNRFAVPASLDEEQRPAFELRMTSWRDAQRKNPEFASHLRLNGVDNLPSGEAGAKFGGPPLRFGGGLDISHTFNTILPPSKYFKDHPDWYSEVGGRRMGANGECTQLCLTNPEVLQMVISNVLERIRKDPSATFYGVSQNDWWNYCTCPGCAAVDKEEESHAGTNVRFVNAVAEAVEREFPGKFIETLAYMYTRKPPKKTKLRHNVVPCLCTIECEFNKPFGVSTNAHNVSFEKDIKGWAEQTRNLFLWDYTTNFRNYLGLLPNVRTLGPNLRFFRDNGVRYMFEQGDSQGRHADFAELKTWLIAKLMWNPDQPVEPLIDRFFDGYYGAAAPYVRRYFEEAQSLGQAPGVKHWGIYDHEASSNVPDAFLVRATNLWAHAARCVEGDDVLAYNVRMGAASPLYMIASRSCADRLAWVTRNPDRYGFKGAQRIIRELMDCRKAAGDIRWIEEEGRNRWRNRTWGRFLSLSDACARSDSAIIYAEDLMQTDGGAKARIVDDGDALGGKAVWLAATGFDWLVRFPANAIACDPGEEYRLRLRVKVDRKPGGNGEAFWAGVYDGVRRRGCGTFSKKVEEVSQGYQWYEVMTGWRPQQGQYFWAGAGRFKGDGESSAHRGVYVDALEISRRKSHETRDLQ